MLNKLFKISLISLVLLGLLLPNFLFNLAGNQIQAEEEITEEILPEEPLFEEPEFPIKSLMPGRIEGTGTYFEIKDSEYLNIILKSSEEITIALESMPRMISMDISSSTDFTSTNLTIKGLEPNKTYYKYQDSYKNEVVFNSAENGSYSWTQDLVERHHVWIQEVKGTIFLPEDCSKYGIWDENTRTCTLTQDLTQSVQISTDNITLDCENHEIRSSYYGGYGIYSYKKSINIKSCKIIYFSTAIFLRYSSNNTIAGNTVQGNGYGISLSRSSNNTLTNNSALNNGMFEIFLFSSHNNTLTSNVASGYGRGIGIDNSDSNILIKNIALNNGISLYFSHNNTLTGNTISNSWRGIYLLSSLSNKIYHNNFINNHNQILLSGYSATGYGYPQNNHFDNGYPSGGNYWSDYNGVDLYSGPDQDQSGSDGMGDTPYTFADGQDRYPFVQENGWEAGVLDITVSDEPDPFTPPYQTNTITITNTPQSTIPCEKVTLSIENINRNWQWENLAPSNSVQAIWDGRDGAGNLVPVGIYNYTATCYQHASPYFQDTETGTITVIYPDFKVDKIDPVQVVWDSKIDDNDTIDLVAGKSTMVRVEIGKENYDALPKDLPLDVQLILTDYGFDFPKTESRTIKQLEQNNWMIDFYPISLEESGNHVIRVEVDPEDKIKESKEDNNFSSIEVTIKNTKGLYLINFPVEDIEGDTPDPTAYQETVKEGGEFVLGTYPISSGEFRNKDGEEKISTKGIQDFCKKFKFWECSLKNNWGRIAALLYLLISGQRITDGVSDISVGIVPKGSLGDDMHGFSSSLIGAVLVEEKYWTVTAHEIGHVHWLWVLKEEDEQYPYPQYPYGRPVEGGFWVDKQFEISDPYPELELSNAYCFMSHFVPWLGNWDNYISVAREGKPWIINTWVDKEDYQNLFKEFRMDQTDPETLLVSGILSKDGSIQFAPWYILPSGKITEEKIGDYLIRILGISGEVISEIPFKATFIDTDIIPFGFSIPYPRNTSEVEILRNEQIIAKIDPKGKLLHDAIDLIPDYGFIKNAEQHRNALHNKIKVIEKMLGQNNVNGAIQKLEHDIKDKLEKWLLDDYQKESLLQYSKSEIIELTNETIERLAIQ